ncbi:hypothetical protein A3D80_04035 [Candidatus Roizmanbacteria bacterium RIFCSPHIGHO2_02_FULL_40_13b]|uniref:Uncharacterized protein n=1 Tax=Candidatus Roizmanbacteria bacterium RIFCSPHIGHO2_01_FULL_39_24 TaxID=1802032 RepID=A0A1F7GKV5_9BACT|nr:MAG: hypothetical protein A2799_00390 [Candidatus Roizmanbacteria bacterium RIFCSPHIGHO2_01_FULL_39_24]OGK27962.1 MAG: hypothetical protein A3D80_04035 [Candidatus Roizmanbacteria bacterium RIFCSPHIGHO2_02_FULL_40_13b]
MFRAEQDLLQNLAELPENDSQRLAVEGLLHIAQAHNALARQIEELSRSDVTPEAVVVDPLVALATEFSAEGVKTPERYTAYWTNRWNILAPRAELTVEIAPCNYSQEELQQLHEDGWALIYRPEGVTREHLGVIHPHLQSWTVEPGNTLKNEQERTGWLVVKDSADSPHLDTTEAQLIQAIQEQGVHGMTVDTYIVFGEELHDRTGVYPDINTWSRLPGSRGGGRVVDARRLTGGRLCVDAAWAPADRYPTMGGRSEGVK